MESKSQDGTFPLSRIIGICAFCAWSKALFRLTRPVWCELIISFSMCFTSEDQSDWSRLHHIRGLSLTEGSPDTIELNGEIYRLSILYSSPNIWNSLLPVDVSRILLYVWQTEKTLVRRRVPRRLIWVYIVCKGLSVPKLRVITVACVHAWDRMYSC